jgi:orc1/cdc6 family replication initiation protein
MHKENISGMFGQFLENTLIFSNKEALRHSYAPDYLPHRKEQIENIASIVAPALKRETPSNILIFGKPGTGKTACVKFVGKELNEVASRKDVPCAFLYLNCEMVDTQYRVLANLVNHFGREVPMTGWPTDKVYVEFRECIEEREQAVIIVLDEIDKLVKRGGDDLLYNLSRMNADLQSAKLSIIGISNDLKFTSYLDSRTLSSLGREEIVFSPYDAEQLKDILKERAKIAFKEGVLSDGVIPLCAAFAAQEHGDARKALDLLRVSGELAEREKKGKIMEEHVKRGKEKIEIDGTMEVVKTLPAQSKIILYSVLLLSRCKKDGSSTGNVYSMYKKLCDVVGLDNLSYRRVADLISELDTLGLINAVLMSRGRYGRTREISLAVPSKTVEKVITGDERMRVLMNTSSKQQTL